MVCYIVLQVLSFAIAISCARGDCRQLHGGFKLSIDLAAIGMAMMLALFLLVREMLIWVLMAYGTHSNKRREQRAKRLVTCGKGDRSQCAR